MKTEQQLNAEILEVTLTIQQKFPELTKFITEMPITIPDSAHPEISIKNLTDYCESLEALLANYSLDHKQ